LEESWQDVHPKKIKPLQNLAETCFKESAHRISQSIKNTKRKPESFAKASMG